MLAQIAKAKKQSMVQERWEFLARYIEKYVSRAQMDDMVAKTAEKIRAFCQGKRAAFAWSGGKDSLALQVVCEAAGATDCLMATAKELEFPEFLSWAQENGPRNLTILESGLDLPWLEKNPGMLFPRDAKIAALWFKKIQHKAQERYFLAQDLDVLILGRRRADGNYIGGKGNYYSSRGVLRYSPLADWDHGHVLAAMFYYFTSIPPIYSWPKGYQCGTHVWPARQHCKSWDEGFREVHSIDSSVIPRAAEQFSPARRWLYGNEHGSAV